MIDIHSHILPGLDDGAPDLKTALKMAKMAEKDGITGMIATPHSYDGNYNCSREEILEACDKFNHELKKESFTLKVYPGAEIRLIPELLEMYKRDELLTIGNLGKAILLELPERFIPEAIIRFVNKLGENGLQVILAHPERNSTIQNNYQVLDELIYAGATVQITAGSLTGKFGRPTKLFTEQLLKGQKVQHLATDSHALRGRAPIMSKAVKTMKKIIGIENATMILDQNKNLVIQKSTKILAQAGH